MPYRTQCGVVVEVYRDGFGCPSWKCPCGAAGRYDLETPGAEDMAENAASGHARTCNWVSA